MPAIITNKQRILAADSFQRDLDQIPLYIYIGRTTPWTDEENPPDVVDAPLDEIESLDEIIGLKRILSSNSISVLKRIDWVNEDVYDEYRDNVNMIDDISPDTGDFYKFYVVTDEFNVYKCISNNNRSPSTTKPTGTSITPFSTPDGYIWKYMYTILSADAFTFMTPNWMPAYTVSYNDGSSQWLVQDSAVAGSIEHAYVTDGGANYNTANPPTVTVNGDGTGATATATIDNVSGTITHIIMTNAGSGYTNATISISGGAGVGAKATPVLSPINGHGSDARVELGATYKMFRTVFDGTEGGVLPIGVDYRRTGLIKSPLTTNTGTILALGDVSLYSVGETVTGATSAATGDISSIDVAKGYLYLNNLVGSFTQGEDVSSQAYNTQSLLQAFTNKNLPLVDLVSDATNYVANSGELLYVATRERISRSVDQKEETRFVVAF